MLKHLIPLNKKLQQYQPDKIRVIKIIRLKQS